MITFKTTPWNADKEYAGFPDEVRAALAEIDRPDLEAKSRLKSSGAFVSITDDAIETMRLMMLSVHNAVMRQPLSGTITITQQDSNTIRIEWTADEVAGGVTGVG